MDLYLLVLTNLFIFFLGMYAGTRLEKRSKKLGKDCLAYEEIKEMK